jgi:hypothetical protein
MKKLALIVAAIVLAVSATAAVSQANDLMRIGFEPTEDTNHERPSEMLWGGPGSTSHGKHVRMSGALRGDRAGNFSIADENNRWLIDDSNSRSGLQSARLLPKDHDGEPDAGNQNYNWYFYELQEVMRNSTQGIRLGWSQYRAGNDDFRQNGFAGVNSGELWQMRITGSGDITFESGGATVASDVASDGMGWYDFEMDFDLPNSKITAARYQAPGDSSFTELLSGAVDFKGGNSATSIKQLVFRPDNTNAHVDTAWDDIFVMEFNPIPEPSTALLLIAGLVGLAASRTRRK